MPEGKNILLEYKLCTFSLRLHNQRGWHPKATARMLVHKIALSQFKGIILIKITATLLIFICLTVVVSNNSKIGHKIIDDGEVLCGQGYCSCRGMLYMSRTNLPLLHHCYNSGRDSKNSPGCSEAPYKMNTTLPNPLYLRQIERSQEAKKSRLGGSGPTLEEKS